MAIAQNHTNSDEDFLKAGLDATAIFDHSPSNPTEYASSGNIDATDDEDEVDEDIDEEDNDEEYEEEEDEEDDDDDESDDDEEDDDEDEDEDEDDDDEDHDLATGPKPPSVYRKV